MDLSRSIPYFDVKFRLRQRKMKLIDKTTASRSCNLDERWGETNVKSTVEVRKKYSADEKTVR